MAGTSEISELQTRTISSEIEETELKINITTQYIKAHKYLVNKLRKKAEQNKETCSFIFTANLKMQSEITQAQQEITSLLFAQDTINKANVELKKEWLLTKEKRLEVIDRVKKGEKKYEDLWVECKARYESLHFVQKLLKSKDEVQNIKQQINELDNVEKIITEEMKTKTETCRETDRKRIIEFAEFMVVEMPKNINLINEKLAAIKEISEELNSLSPNTNDTEPSNADSNNDLKAKSECTSLVPKLKLNCFDFDNLDANLDQIKDDDQFIKTPEKTYSVHSIVVIDPSKLNKKKAPKNEDYMSLFFFNPIAKYEANTTQNYARKKLINILDDITIDKNEARRMIADVNPEELQEVNEISIVQQNIKENGMLKSNRHSSMDVDNQANEEVEEIDMSASGMDKMLLPPTQFLDNTPMLQVSQKEQTAEVFDQASLCKQKSSQEEPSRKKVKLDFPKEVEIKSVDHIENPEHEGEIETDATMNSHLNASDDGFDKMKDMIMKKHNLDLSPQFIYAKNIITPLNLQKPEDAVVTSKFFTRGEDNQENSEIDPEVTENIAIEEDQPGPLILAKEVAVTPGENANDATSQIFQDKLLMETQSNSINHKVTELTIAEKPSGFLFGQSTQITSDFLDESMNTTGFEDGDGIPSCLDASLLLSPKADLSLPHIESQEVRSQDMPNFLTGLRKTGLSFFGHLSESKPDSSSQNQNQGASGFTFNFGGDEKKSRGGVFNMFQ